MKDRGRSRKTDPWSSKEVDEINITVDLLTEILHWLPAKTVRACGDACGYAADWEITEAMLPFFPEIYEGEIRRQMRILRERNRTVVTVSKSEHKHRNPDTNRWQQCHKVAPRKRVIPRQYC